MWIFSILYLRSTQDTQEYQKSIKMVTNVSMSISFCEERCVYKATAVFLSGVCFGLHERRAFQLLAMRSLISSIPSCKMHSASLWTQSYKCDAEISSLNPLARYALMKQASYAFLCHWRKSALHPRVPLVEVRPWWVKGKINHFFNTTLKTEGAP